MDRLTGVTDLDGVETRYTYDGIGQRIQTESGTLKTEYEYDSVGNLIGQITTGETEIGFRYGYNKNNLLMEETRTENGSSEKSKYTYDKLGQLTAWSRSDGYSESYTYDPVGNMTAKVTNGTKLSMTYDAANELKTMESVNGRIDYSYDANGNLMGKELNGKQDTYTYSVQDQLTAYTGYDGYAVRYTYDAAGMLTAKEVKGNPDRLTPEEILSGKETKNADIDPSAEWVKTSYICDITASYYEVLTETTNGQTTAYTYGAERLAAHTGNTKTQYVYDGRGSVAQEIGNGILSKSYTPFGEQLNSKVSGYGYNGEYYDSATGMLDLRARQYEPAQMRFSQKDILKGNKAIPLTQNLYAYCINDPVNLIDPSGHKMVSVDTINVGGGSEAGRKVAEIKEKTAQLTANVSALIKAAANGTTSLTNAATVAAETVKAKAKSIADIEDDFDAEIRSNFSTNTAFYGLSGEELKSLSEKTSPVLAKSNVSVTDLWKTVELCTYGPVKSIEDTIAYNDQRGTKKSSIFDLLYSIFKSTIKASIEEDVRPAINSIQELQQDLGISSSLSQAVGGSILGLSLEERISLVFDSGGTVAIQLSHGTTLTDPIGKEMPTVYSYTVIGATNALSYENYQDRGYSAGSSFSVPIPHTECLSGLGGINTVILPADEQTYYGGEIIVGGISVSENNALNFDLINAGWSQTKTLFEFNIYNLADRTVENILEWCER